MYFSSIKERGKGNKSWAFWAFFLLVFWTPPLNINLVCFYLFFPFSPFIEKCFYDQIFDILFFHIFVHNWSFLDIFPNLHCITKYRAHVFWNISVNLRPLLTFLVPLLENWRK